MLKKVAPKAKERGIGPQGGKKKVDLTQKTRLTKRFEALRVNWESADPKYWIERPNWDYKFKAEVMYRMERLMPQEDWDRFIIKKYETDSVMRAANFIRAPWYLCWWLYKRHETALKKVEKNVEKKEQSGIIDRLRKIQRTTLEELEVKMKEPEKLAPDEVLRIFAGVSKVISEFETNQGDLSTLDMKVVMATPLAPREVGALEGLDPTLEEAS